MKHHNCIADYVKGENIIASATSQQSVNRIEVSIYKEMYCLYNYYRGNITVCMRKFISASTILCVYTYVKTWYRSHTLHWRLLLLESEKCAVVLPFAFD